MRNGYIYTIVFMFIISVIFTGVLAAADSLTADKIEANRVFAEKKAILAALALDQDGSDPESVYDQRVNTVQIRDKTIYSGMDEDGSVVSYALQFTGSGLWGTISGFIGVLADLTAITGIEFTDQNETPGLGGRITEDWFKEQFAGVKIDLSKRIQYGDGIDAIAGATSSSNAVLDLINDFLDENMVYLEEIR